MIIRVSMICECLTLLRVNQTGDLTRLQLHDLEGEIIPIHQTSDLQGKISPIYQTSEEKKGYTCSIYSIHICCM